jgi:hypothetical protein
VRREPGLEEYIAGEVAGSASEYMLPDVEPPWDLDKAAALIDLDNLRHPDRPAPTSSA